MLISRLYFAWEYEPRYYEIGNTQKCLLSIYTQVKWTILEWRGPWGFFLSKFTGSSCWMMVLTSEQQLSDSLVLEKKDQTEEGMDALIKLFINWFRLTDPYVLDTVLNAKHSGHTDEVWSPPGGIVGYLRFQMWNGWSQSSLLCTWRSHLAAERREPSGGYWKAHSRSLFPPACFRWSSDWAHLTSGPSERRFLKNSDRV